MAEYIKGEDDPLRLIKKGSHTTNYEVSSNYYLKAIAIMLLRDRR